MHYAFSFAGLRVGGTVTPARKGVRTLPNGDPGYPDEPAIFELDSLVVDSLDEMWLSDEVDYESLWLAALRNGWRIGHGTDLLSSRFEGSLPAGLSDRLEDLALQSAEDEEWRG